MQKTLRGRPPLALGLAQILDTVYRHRQLVAAAQELGCSPAYIHVKLKALGLTLRDVLEAPTVQSLLSRVEAKAASHPPHSGPPAHAAP